MTGFQCRKCSTELTLDNWRKGERNANSCICADCIREYDRKLYRHLHPYEGLKRPSMEGRKAATDCNKCGDELTDKNWPQSLQRRHAKICRVCYNAKIRTWAALNADKISGYNKRK